jgi:hypothetical protein
MLEVAFCKLPVTLKIMMDLFYTVLILKQVTENPFKHSEAGYRSPVQWS